MKRFDVLMNRRLLAAVAMGGVVWAAVQTARPGDAARDVFRKGNQAQIDPFGDKYQAPKVEVMALDLPAPREAEAGFQAKEPPFDPKQISDLIDFEVAISPKEVKRGQTVQVTVTGIPRKGCHTYSMTKKTPDQSGPVVSTFKINSQPGLQPLPPIEESKSELVVEPNIGEFFEHKQKFTWVFDVLVQQDAKVGKVDFPFVVKMQACNEKTCIPGDLPLLATIVVLPGEPIAVSAELKERAGQKFPPAAREVTPKNDPGKENTPRSVAPKSMSDANIAGVPRDNAESLDRIKKQIKEPDVKPAEGLIAFMLTGMFWGFVSLITPCVFPMIPITVSFFLKQSEKEHHKPVTMALVYCGTIVLVLTIAAAALLNFFRVLSISPAMNFGLGLLFIFFALSLFGMYDIELPSFLARYTSEREGRGGMVGTIFMALTFTIISFACVAPFLGGFGGTATSSTRPFWHTILGGLAFSMTFAAPFFFLALFPTLLRAMPKSGAWLNSVKVVMGFLELAAALKFLRAGELVLSSTPSLFTFDLVLGLWVAICLLCGLYLLGLYRLPHDSPVENLSVPRMLFSFLFLGLGLYLVPALFVTPAEGEQSRPSGAIFAWVNSFLLPDAKPSKGGEVWTANLEQAVAQAREERRRTGKPKLIFIDFTGVTCTNCKLNENDVFSKSEIKNLFKPYALVKLYTDSIPIDYYSSEDRQLVTMDNERRERDAQLNSSFEAAVFNTKTLPLYVILEPQLDFTIKVVSTYEQGRIRDQSEFAAFLRKPQEAIGTTVAAR